MWPASGFAISELGYSCRVGTEDRYSPLVACSYAF